MCFHSLEGVLSGINNKQSDSNDAVMEAKLCSNYNSAFPVIPSPGQLVNYVLTQP